LNNVAVYDGGAIQHDGSSAEIRGSAFVYNRSGVDKDGGAIAGGVGTLAVINSTFLDNRAERHGGAIYLVGTSYLYNVTIYDNLADLGHDGVGDGGGIHRSESALGLTTVANSIIAGNVDLSSSANPKEHDCKGNFLSAGYNLIGQMTAGCLGFSGADQVGTPGSPIDPMLATVLYNGGQMVTKSLQPGSPAIDAGNPGGCRDHLGAALLSDQRGWDRHIDGDGDGTAECDVGAYENPRTLYLPLIQR
jgi:predicted outer membrane repeat protein